MAALKRVAAEIVNHLIVQQIQTEINEELVASIKVRAAPDSEDVAHDMQPSIESSISHIETKREDYTLAQLEKRIVKARDEMEAFLDDAEWIRSLG